MTTKKTGVPTAFRYQPDLLARVRALAADRHWTVTTALHLLLDRALTDNGYPPTEAPQDTAGPKG
jgi:hypothetical protein